MIKGRSSKELSLTWFRANVFWIGLLMITVRHIESESEPGGEMYLPLVIAIIAAEAGY